MCTTCGCGAAPAHLDGHPLPDAPEAPRRLHLEQALLAENDRLAAANRARLEAAGILAVNLLSSPGSGKTTLLERTLLALRGERPLAVIEGDQHSDLDRDRIRATGVPAVQVNTGAGCHLDAHHLAHALERLDPAPGTLLFIENVGNLVCPAAFDLGEARRVVLLSVTEGEDKPLKYPAAFAGADLLLFTKTDLLPHLDFDPGRALDYARRLRPGLPALSLSARRGDGLDAWLDWLRRTHEDHGPRP